MQNFEAPYFWQQAPAQRLIEYTQQNRLPHALLLHGTKGLGKLEFATAFAKFLLCTCNEDRKCQSCSLFEAGNHPDYLCIQPEESAKFIKIDQIRLLKSFLAQTKHISMNRVIIIEPCDLLNLAGANALLKCLEEPTPNTMIMLITANTNSLPATLISRCQRLNFPCVDIASNQQQLSQFDHTKNFAYALQLASGAPLLARQMLQDGKLEQFEQFAQSLLDLLSGHIDPLSVYRTCEKMNTIDLLQWQLLILQDILYRFYGAVEESVCESHYLDKLYAHLAHIDIRKCYPLMDKLVESLRNVYLSLNQQMVIESLLFNWLALLSVKR